MSRRASTSSFSRAAVETATKLNARIVLIDGVELARLMIAYDVGSRVTQTYRVPEIDEGFFE